MAKAIKKRFLGAQAAALMLLLAPTWGQAAGGPITAVPSPLQPQLQSVPSPMAEATDPSWLGPGGLDNLIPEERQRSDMRIKLRDSLEVNLDIENDGSRELSGTTGIWRPTRQVSLKAGFTTAQQSLAAFGGCVTGETDYLGCLAMGHGARTGDASVSTYVVGASWQPSERFSVSVDYYSRDHEALIDGALGASAYGSARASEAMAHANQATAARTEGVDVSLSCDFSAGSWGDLELGLQLSRVTQQQALAPETTIAADPYTSAVLGLGWQRGDFRGDLTSRHLDLLPEAGDDQGRWSTLDINFAWRTPWNASVSVGARNVLNTPAPDAANAINDVQFEDFLGRVPYVRYQQDL